MNSLIPTERQYDEYYAHRCVDCDTPFSRVIRPAGDCEDGDICQDCWEVREESDLSQLLDSLG